MIYNCQCISQQLWQIKYPHLFVLNDVRFKSQLYNFLTVFLIQTARVITCPPPIHFELFLKHNHLKLCVYILDPKGYGFIFYGFE